MDAVKEYKKIIEIDPQEAYVNSRLASIYVFGIKDKERADYYYNRYAELNNSRNVDSAESTTGFLESTKKNKVVNVVLDGSIQGLNQADKQGHLQSGKPVKYVETFEDQSFKRHYNLALIYEDEQRYEDAVKEYEKTLELEPFNADVYYNLGILYDGRIKDKNKAVFYYQKYLELSPGAEDAQQVKNWITKVKDELDWQQKLK